MSVQDKVYALHQVDKQLRGIRSRVETAQARLTRQNGKLDQLQQQRSEVASQLKHEKVKASTLEGQVASTDQRIGQLREQLNTVKSNKEYSALLLEVNTFKEEKSQLEDQALEEMGRTDMLEEELQQLDQKLDEQKARVAVAKKDLKECEKEVGAKLDELTTQRAEAESEVPATAKQFFDRIAVIHEGEAMVGIVETNRRAKEYSCGGCYMAIPIERVNALMNNNMELVCCPNCNRILHLDEEMKGTIGVKPGKAAKAGKGK